MNVLYDADKLRKMVSYVAATQPVLEKVANVDSMFAKRVPEVVDALVRQGLLSPHLKEAKVKSLLENPAEILVTLEKTAALVAPKSMGSGDGQSASAKKSDDVFISRLLG
jgi:hypothetical protein